VTFAQSAWLTWTGVELCRVPRAALNSP
jgi:hypothetical protein